MISYRHVPTVAAALIAMLGASASTVLAAPSCRVESSTDAPAVVELYTSEGCSSCPPADRWLSRVGDAPGTVALAYHVDYWDRLGWRDRFSSPAFTERQALQRAVNGARFSYTPQVVVDGIDRPDWPRTLPGAHRGTPAPVRVQLSRDGDEATATVTPLENAPGRLSGFWAVTEQGHVSIVKAGENQGATLSHDHVVRDYRTLPPWQAARGAGVSFRLEVRGPEDPAHPRRIDFVVTDAASGRPIQAVALGC